MEENKMNENQNSASKEMPKKDSKKGSSDVEKNKALAIIGYIIPILFFVPLITDAKDSPFAKFHANQHLVLLISWVVVNVVGGIVPFIGWFIILPLGTIFLIIVAIMGIISSAKGEMKKLPVIGSIEIIK